MTMQRLYKIEDLVICVSATINDLSYHLWRDLIRCAWSSTDLAIVYGGYGIYRFAEKADVDRAVVILNGALFEEATLEQWEQFINLEVHISSIK